MRIAIIGGGIGGLTTALALRQFGFEPEVFEQAPDLLEVGAAILMWPNAMRVLQRLGLGETIRERGGILERACWLNYDGRVLNNFRLPKTELPAVVLHRAELQRALLEPLPDESIHLGQVFESYQQSPDKIVAHFGDQSSFAGHLLIAADGIHSQARAQLLNDGRPDDRGYLAWRGVVANPSASLTEATAFEIYGAGQRFGIGPLGRGKVGWWASTNRPVRSADALTALDELTRLFAGWWEPVLELIRATPPTALIRNDVCDRRVVRRWGQGSMTLLGDAIHPVTPNLGQGGCLAIEDAAVLARCLHKYAPAAGGAPEQFERSIALALRRFAALRFARTATVARCSRMYGVVGQWEYAPAVKLRRILLSLVPAGLSQYVLGRLFDYDAYGVSI